MKLTNEQKNQLIELYWDDFYAMNIIDWFSEFYPKETKKALLKVLKYMGISHKNWKVICKATNNFEFWASEQYDDIVINTMWALLESASIDPYNA